MKLPTLTSFKSKDILLFLFNLIIAVSFAAAVFLSNTGLSTLNSIHTSMNKLNDAINTLNHQVSNIIVNQHYQRDELKQHREQISRHDDRIRELEFKTRTMRQDNRPRK